MKKGVIWIALAFLMVTSLVLASCATSTSTNTYATTPTSNSTTTSATTLTTSSSNSTTSATTQTSITETTTSTGNWWDSLGIPQYGDELVLRAPAIVPNFDPYSSVTSVAGLWMERLIGDDWTLDPSVFAYYIDWRPSEYVVGNIASGWEFTNPSTLVVHLKQNVYWQNIQPINGRQFTAADAVAHYDRLYGLGGGYTSPGSYFTTSPITLDVTSLTAPDKFTVVFNWKVTSPEFILETFESISAENLIEAPEAVQQWGNLNDWHHAMGTGPFILQDYVDGMALTLIKNPNYWAHDERYPQNQLPYVHEIKILIIASQPTALAAMRTGKIDFIDGVSLTDAQSMQKTNPEIDKLTLPTGATSSVDIKNNVKPFSDVRVREAMQMAIDLPTISTTYYGGVTPPYPSSLTSRYETGWGLPYTQWPATLQQEYAYNTTTAKQLLAAAGYPNGFNTDVIADSSGDINLLQIVQSYFAAVGINMTIQLMDPATWSAYVKKGHNEDALAYAAQGQLGFSYEPLRQLQHYQTGYSVNYSMISDPTFDAFYPAALAASTLDQVKQILINANLYFAQQHFGVSLLNPNLFAIYEPWLNGYTGQADSLSNGQGQMIGFYTARFWIDQNVKSGY